MSEPYPPGFSGIDPDLMNQMIAEFRRGRADIAGTIATYRGPLARCGVDTSALGQIDRVCGWMDEQLPMLTRRRDLAVALDDSSEPGMAVVDESLILSPAEARCQGAALARRFKDVKPDDGAYHDLLTELGMHRFNAEYGAAFFAALGPEATRQLPALIRKYGREGHVEIHLRQTSESFGSAVSGGMDVPGFAAVTKSMFVPNLPEHSPV
jgi:hypothetical protein